MIQEEKGNALSAQPFFRERKEVFGQKIIKIIKKEQISALKKFNVNFLFISFVMNQRKWGKSSILTKIFKEIKDARNVIIEINTPLALSVARKFWSSTNESHLSYMDIVQRNTEGLIMAIDKYVLPYSTVFRSVAIGRMTSGFIEDYSGGNQMHYYPNDRNKLYKANKILKTESDVDAFQLSEKLNETGTQTTPDEIRDLLESSSTVSADVPFKTDDKKITNISNSTAIDTANQPDNNYETTELSFKLLKSMDKLTLLEKKFLVLKGVLSYNDYIQSIKSRISTK
jgi:DNA-directed RNA polymerase specialized sigma subunit